MQTTMFYIVWLYILIMFDIQWQILTNVFHIGDSNTGLYVFAGFAALGLIIGIIVLVFCGKCTPLCDKCKNACRGK